MTTLLSTEQLSESDKLGRMQREGVISICQQSKSMADAGRLLFAISREQRQSSNDSDRVKKYLAKFGLTWRDVSF